MADMDKSIDADETLEQCEDALEVLEKEVPA